MVHETTKGAIRVEFPMDCPSWEQRSSQTSALSVVQMTTDTLPSAVQPGKAMTVKEMALPSQRGGAFLFAAVLANLRANALIQILFLKPLQITQNGR